MKKISSVLVVCIMLVALCGCGKKTASENDLVGKWTHTSASGSEHTYVFNTDGTIELLTKLTNGSGTYTVKDNVISYTLTIDKTKDTKTSEMSFRFIDKDTLELTMNNHPYEYIRQ